MLPPLCPLGEGGHASPCKQAWTDRRTDGQTDRSPHHSQNVNPIPSHLAALQPPSSHDPRGRTDGRMDGTPCGPLPFNPPFPSRRSLAAFYFILFSHFRRLAPPPPVRMCPPAPSPCPPSSAPGPDLNLSRAGCPPQLAPLIPMTFLRGRAGVGRDGGQTLQGKVAGGGLKARWGSAEPPQQHGQAPHALRHHPRGKTPKLSPCVALYLGCIEGCVHAPM